MIRFLILEVRREQLVLLVVLPPFVALSPRQALLKVLRVIALAWTSRVRMGVP